MEKSSKSVLTRLSAAVVLLAMLVSNASACGSAESGGSTDDAVTTAANSETETAAESETAETSASYQGTALPDADYEGYEFRIMHNLATTATAAWNIADVDADEENGDLINDAVYKRNLGVEEKYNCLISALPVDSGSLATTVHNTVLAADNAADAVLRDIDALCTMTLKGDFANLADNEYLDFTGDWWASSVMKGISVGGKIYFATGDICLNDDKATWSTLFNKKLAENYGLPDMYQLVRDGGWTIDVLYQYASAAAVDVNGDDKMTLEEDQWGLYDQLETAAAFYLSAGTPAIEIGDDGSVIYNLSGDKSVSTFGKIYNYMSDESFQWIADNYTVDDKWNTLRRYFRADGALFYNVTISALTLIRDMETDFGLLPIPKMYDDQDSYNGSFQSGNATAYAVPVTSPDLDRTSVILEALARASKTTLTPAYYDMTLQQKAVRDEDSIEMMELIFSNRIFDFSMAFSDVGTMAFIKAQIGKSSNGFVSAEASQHDKILSGVDKVLTTIEGLN